jgi:hypothetical protein
MREDLDRLATEDDRGDAQKFEGGHRNVKRPAALCVRSIARGLGPVSNFIQTPPERAFLSGSSYRLKVNPHRSNELLLSIAASWLSLAPSG